MFLEQIAVLTLQLRAKFRSFLNYLRREADSQLGQIFFTCCFILLTVLLYYTWVMPGALWIKIIFTLLYLVASLLCLSALYFVIKRKRIKNNLKVYSLDDHELQNFQDFNLQVIPLNEAQVEAIFKAFSDKYLYGKYQSFRSLILLKPISAKNRLQWIDQSPRRPKQVNRQTLLEFLSQLLIGFEKLDNHQIILFVNQYFSLKNSDGIQQHVSTKNISDWRNNYATYLKEISKIFKSCL